MSIVEEFREAAFSDRRLGARLVRIVEGLALDPTQSFPDAAGSDGALEGTYRFLANDAVSPEAIMAPHVRATVKRLAGRTVLVAHDTTEFRFAAREGMGRLTGPGTEGFLSHVSLAVEPGELRMPVGLLAIQNWSRTGPAKTKKTKSKRTDKIPESEKESKRWFEQVERAEQAASGNDAALIHLMDSEADAYPLLCHLSAAKYRFAVRLHVNRTVVSDDFAKLDEQLSSARIRTRREVPISARKKSRASQQVKKGRHAVREARIAELEISASKVTLVIPDRSPQDLPKTLTINVVRVFEPHPPEGEESILWQIATSESIRSIADIERVVDAYRSRWVIEEFFKAIKTGTAFEKRQLESYAAITKALAIFAPIAYELLRMRVLARADNDTPAHEALRPSLLVLLHRHPQLRLPRTATVRDAYLAIAQLGGHIKNNGHPGWMVLGRGYEKLLAMELGMLIARKNYDQ
jgi:Transposase DNA-binding/Transposase DDE domain